MMAERLWWRCKMQQFSGNPDSVPTSILFSSYFLADDVQKRELETNKRRPRCAYNTVQPTNLPDQVHPSQGSSHHFA